MAVFHKVVTTLWLLLIIQTTTSISLKDFIRPSKISEATRPIVGDYLYVDKTKYAQVLCEKEGNGNTYFFVRPRRFGKTTFLKTLQAIFDGRGRYILNGTHIHGTDYSWEAYPVLYLDFGQYVVENDDTCGELMKTPRFELTKFEKKMNRTFKEFETTHSLPKPTEIDLPLEFSSILQGKRKNGNSTVVLIDEYDFPILNNINSCPVAAEINRILVRDIFLQMKEFAGLIKFAFVTGISQSVFSILGTAFDLMDLSHNQNFHEIAGLTESELKTYYGDHIKELSDNIGKPESNITNELKEWYDGYNFSSQARSSLYNPESVRSYFNDKMAKCYGTRRQHAPFLFQQMVKRPDSFSRLDMKNGLESPLVGGIDLDNTDPAVLLYDAGYLSIHGFSNGEYVLKFPNKEIEEAYYRDIEFAAWVSENSTEPQIQEIYKSLKKSVPDFIGFMHAINVAMMKMPIRAPFEEWYSWQMMLLMKRAKITNVKLETPIELFHSTKKTKKVVVTTST